MSRLFLYEIIGPSPLELGVFFLFFCLLELEFSRLYKQSMNSFKGDYILMNGKFWKFPMVWCRFQSNPRCRLLLVSAWCWLQSRPRCWLIGHILLFSSFSILVELFWLVLESLVLFTNTVHCPWTTQNFPLFFLLLQPQITSFYVF